MAASTASSVGTTARDPDTPLTRKSGRERATDPIGQELPMSVGVERELRAPLQGRSRAKVLLAAVESAGGIRRRAAAEPGIGLATPKRKLDRRA
jgi:hypothetical protein